MWPTKIFNDHLAGLGNALTGLVGFAPQPRPWANFVVMEILVAAILIVMFALLRPRLSVDRPGKFQHIFELAYDFLNGQTEEQVGHHGSHYLGFFGTLFFFILFMNLIGVIPGFESPTMNPSVPAGCALATFLYYNIVGVGPTAF